MGDIFESGDCDYEFHSEPTMARRVARERALQAKRAGQPPKFEKIEVELKQGPVTGWDKYYYFSDPAVNMHARMRPAQDGHNTFVEQRQAISDLITNHKTKSKSAAEEWCKPDGTEHRDGYRLWGGKYSFDVNAKPEPTANPHIFPHGHLTYNRILANLECDKTQGYKAPITSVAMTHS